jgi:hypothetical protein
VYSPLAGLWVPPVQASQAVLADASLVVVGGPTHVHGMSRAATRKSAVQAAHQPVSPLQVEADALGPGLREWFGSLGRYPVKAAAFDTRMHGPASLTGRPPREWPVCSARTGSTSWPSWDHDHRVVSCIGDRQRD